MGGVGRGFLLDTNALSEPVRAKPNAAFMARWQRELPAVAISAVTWHEAMNGLSHLPADSRRRAVLETYLRGLQESGLPILPYDAASAEWHADMRARLDAAGTPVSYQDAQIAAVAATNGLTLVTANLREFERFPGLMVESWLG